MTRLVDPREWRLRTLRLRDEHQDIDRRCNEVVRLARMGDWRDLDVIWPAFCRELEDHMDFEESRLFPAFEAAAPHHAKTVRSLQADHLEFREDLEKLGVEIQLHCIRAERVEALARKVREHAQVESETLYQWAEMNV